MIRTFILLVLSIFIINSNAAAQNRFEHCYEPESGCSCSCDNIILRFNGNNGGTFRCEKNNGFEGRICNVNECRFTKGNDGKITITNSTGETIAEGNFDNDNGILNLTFENRCVEKYKKDQSPYFFYPSVYRFLNIFIPNLH